MNIDDDKISSLYQEAGKPAPSKRLDDAILAASRDAVDRRAATKEPFSGSWPAAASIAAVIVITIILVPVLKQQESQQALTQTSEEGGSLQEVSDETGLNAYRSTAAKMKSMNAPSPAGEPAMMLEESDVSGYQATPARSRTSASTVKSPTAGAPVLEKEEIQAETGTSGMERSIMQAADSAPFAILTPEMWQVKISRLMAEGKTDDARAEIDKLKKHYPEYIIDPDLLEKLK